LDGEKVLKETAPVIDWVLISQGFDDHCHPGWRKHYYYYYYYYYYDERILLSKWHLNEHILPHPPSLPPPPPPRLPPPPPLPLPLPTLATLQRLKELIPNVKILAPPSARTVLEQYFPINQLFTLSIGDSIMIGKNDGRSKPTIKVSSGSSGGCGGGSSSSSSSGISSGR